MLSSGFRLGLAVCSLVMVGAAAGSVEPGSGLAAPSAGHIRLQLAHSELDIRIEDRSLLKHRERLQHWIKQSADTVSHYYGRFPVEHLLIRVQAVPGFRVRFGQAFGGDKPWIRVEVGEQIDDWALTRDWIMVHEMVHLAMAGLPKAQRWILEGLATYVESVARVQAGQLDEDFVWRNFIDRMPQGLAREDDRGLDHTPTWGRTYWGGAIFFLLADIEIRRLSDNRQSLRDALRGILQAGYSMHREATVLKVLSAGDKATGYPVLVKQYGAMRDRPVPTELDSVWRQLGIELDNGRVVYNQQAPLAAVRKAFFSS